MTAQPQIALSVKLIRTLGPEELRLFGFLWALRAEQRDLTWDEIAIELGVSTRSIAKWMAALKRRGLVIVEKQAGGPALYHLRRELPAATAAEPSRQAS